MRDLLDRRKHNTHNYDREISLDFSFLAAMEGQVMVT